MLCLRMGLTLLSSIFANTLGMLQDVVSMRRQPPYAERAAVIEALLERDAPSPQPLQDMTAFGMPGVHIIVNLIIRIL